MSEKELQDIIDSLRAMIGRFQPPTTAAAPHLSAADRAAFKRLTLEAKSILDVDLGHLNAFSTPLNLMTKIPGYGAFNPPSHEELEEAIGIVEVGLNQVRRERNLPLQPIGVPKPPYVEPSRIAELQTLREPLNNSERWRAPRDSDGPQGANRSHSLGYGEDLQRRGRPEARMRDT